MPYKEAAHANCATCAIGWLPLVYISSLPVLLETGHWPRPTLACSFLNPELLLPICCAVPLPVVFGGLGGTVARRAVLGPEVISWGKVGRSGNG